jgi:peroxiredoxin (alkyl hydroperoxide reductase subunit C)
MDGAAADVSLPLRPGSPAPDFQARTTQGDRSLTNYKGRWLLFFSHPADFTPVCTSEFVALSRAAPRFEAQGCDLLGLSVDSLFSHITWALDIEQRFGVEIGFPIVEDPSMAIAAAYGMIDAHSGDSATVRGTFFIDPQGIVRAITWYPMTNGRSVDEMFRLLCALQETDKTGALTPEGWLPGADTVEPAPLTLHDARERGGADAWYVKARSS